MLTLANWQITPEWNVSLGLRYIDDEKPSYEFRTLSNAQYEYFLAWDLGGVAASLGSPEGEVTVARGLRLRMQRETGGSEPGPNAVPTK